LTLPVSPTAACAITASQFPIIQLAGEKKPSPSTMKYSLNVIAKLEQRQQLHRCFKLNLVMIM
jgi:hypothetical protein